MNTLKKTLRFFSGTTSAKYNRIVKSSFKMFDHKYFLTNLSIAELMIFVQKIFCMCSIYGLVVGMILICLMDSVFLLKSSFQLIFYVNWKLNKCGYVVTIYYELCTQHLK